MWDKNAVHVTLGSILAKQRKWPEAGEQFEKACELLPQYSDNWQKLGQAYLRMGRRSEAINALQRAVDINPADEDCRKALASAQTGLGAGAGLLIKANGAAPRADGLLAGLKRMFGSAPRMPSPR